MNERRGTKGLELWCRKITEGYPGVKIDNMTTSWRDGLAFCAIIHHFRPDLIDFSKLNKDDIHQNNELAFRVAEQYLGIPALLEPEDMVEYTVPDRLSILTYLSQFYQTFAVREGASAARIAQKRPQTPSEHGIMSPASTSPPTKVALTPGKLRRELCAKCGLPVFIAERLNVGKSLFHRACFRCARCNSELTLANYYETENSEYCCEICPDEEKIASAQKAVLLRSKSDEDKSASLNAFTNEPDEFSAVFESAVENVDEEKVETLSKEFGSARSSFFQSQILYGESSDSATEDKKEEPPDLPKTLRPLKSSADSFLDWNKSAINDSVIETKSNSGFPSKNIVNTGFNVTLSSVQESQNVVTKEESSEESLVKTRRRLFENNFTDIKADVNRKTVPVSPSLSIPISIKRELSNISDQTHSRHNWEKMYDKKPTHIPLNEISTKNQYDTVITHSPNNEDDKITDLNESDISIDNSTFSKYVEKDNSEDSDSNIKAVNDCVEIIKTPKVTTTDECEKADYKLANESIESNSLNTNIVEKENSNIDVSVSLSVTDCSVDESKIEAVNYDVKEIEDSKSEETIETVNQENVVETVIDYVKNDNNFVEAINTNISASNEHRVLKKMESYPESLNPFDEDDSSLNHSLNPFDTDDEKEVLLYLNKPVPSPRFKKKVIHADMSQNANLSIQRVSSNPFESDGDEKPVPVLRRKKISAPKISLNPFSSDEDENEDVEVKPVPLPRNQTNSSGDVKPKESLGLLKTNIHFGSNSSISSGSHYGSARKKRPAPKPPIPEFSDNSKDSSITSISSQSVQYSPKAALKHRKNKRAPLRPPTFASTPNFKREHEEPMESPVGVQKKDSEIEQEKCDKYEVNKNNPNMQNTPLIDAAPNKSTYGKWKRKKGQAPLKPILQKRTIKCLPMAEIKKELDFIEVQLQGLEKQGVRLELIIRDKCEGNGNEDAANDDIPIDVEDLILQLFELVNEKNELFRKQTELMYLRRQQRLEEEHADVEYQIRCLMMQPEAKKTDHDNVREEELIKKLVDIVERRNQIVECLEMDRIREAEEDYSISNHINLFALNRESDKSQVEKSKKEKDKQGKKKIKKEKKSKQKSKSGNLDADKDVDTSEEIVGTLEKKKNKKFNLF